MTMTSDQINTFTRAEFIAAMIKSEWLPICTATGAAAAQWRKEVTNKVVVDFATKTKA